MSLADAKKRFSELIRRVAYNKGRFLIERRVKPLAALVSTEDLARLKQEPETGQGLLSAVGACADFDEWDEMVEEIYRQREQAQNLPVTPET